MPSSHYLPHAVFGFCGIVLLVLLAEIAFPRKEAPYVPPVAETACEGEPIAISQAYDGGVVEPWTCQVQCTDQKRRYILYSNGVATQCDELPGCNDWGEDSGVTCTPPNATRLSS